MFFASCALLSYLLFTTTGREDGLVIFVYECIQGQDWAQGKVLKSQT